MVLLDASAVRWPTLVVTGLFHPPMRRALLQFSIVSVLWDLYLSAAPKKKKPFFAGSDNVFPAILVDIFHPKVDA